jgi:RHS repeat-associated protein
LKFFNHPEGYVDASGSGYEYVYQYKDHLGNVRLSYKDISTTSTPVLEIQKETNYYPFGLSHKGYNTTVNSTNAAEKYLFGGKELQDDDVSGNKLDWYDFGARNYDAALGRWMNVDPLADQFPKVTPYNYAFNNPLSFIDMDGRSSDPVLSKTVQHAIHNAPASRAQAKIDATHRKIFGEGAMGNSPVLASIPKTERYIFKEGYGRALLGRNEIDFTATFSLGGRDFTTKGYYQKKSRVGGFDIRDVIVRKSRSGSRYITDNYGGYGGYAVDLSNGGATIIRLSFKDAETHEIFEKLLDDATNSYLNNLIENNEQIKELYSLSDSFDELTEFYNENILNKSPDKKTLDKYNRMRKQYSNRRRRYNDLYNNAEFWRMIIEQIEEGMKNDPRNR